MPAPEAGTSTPGAGMTPEAQAYVDTVELFRALTLIAMAAAAKEMAEAEQRAEMERARKAKEKEEQDKQREEQERQAREQQQRDKSQRERVENDARHARENLPEQLREIAALPKAERIATLKELLYNLACEQQAVAIQQGSPLDDPSSAVAHQTMAALSQLEETERRAFAELASGPLAGDVRVRTDGLYLAPNEGDGGGLIFTSNAPGPNDPQITLVHGGVVVGEGTVVGLGEDNHGMYLAVHNDTTVGPVPVQIRYPGDPNPMNFNAQILIPASTVMEIDQLDERHQHA